MIFFGKLLFALAFILFCLEFLVRLVFFPPAELKSGAAQLWQGYTNMFTQGTLEKLPGCSFGDLLKPHPYLGFIYRDDSSCRLPEVNNLGFSEEKPFPFEKSEEYFDIMITGGSVAAHLAMRNLEGNALEKLLNDRYLSPNRKPFRIFSAAVGSWSMPAPLHAVQLYGSAMRGVVLVDGYNEAFRATANDAITMPDSINYLYTLNPIPTSSTMLIVKLAQNIRIMALSSRLGKHSFLFFWLYKNLLAPLARNNEAAFQDRHDAVEKYFSLPIDWTKEKKLQWNQRKYREYIESFNSVAKTEELKFAHFVQPILALKNFQSNDERKIRDAVSSDTFTKVIVEQSRQLKRKGLNSFLLTDLFHDQHETIFADGVHCKLDDHNRSAGYQMMSEAIAKQLAMSWGFSPKQ